MNGKYSEIITCYRDAQMKIFSSSTYAYTKSRFP